MRLLPPLKAALLTFSAASAVAIGAAAIEWRDASSGTGAPEPGDPAATATDDREFFVPNTQTWLGARAIGDPGLGYKNAPNCTTKACYADNPRGYFEVEEIYGPQDMRVASLRALPPAMATIRPTRERAGTVRVEPTAIDAEAAWRLSVEFLQIPLRAGVRYTLSVRARADRPRPMRLVSVDPTNQYAVSGLGQTVALQQDWREFSATFVATRTSNQSIISFEVGKDMAAVELTAFTLQANTRQDVLMEPDRWRSADQTTALERSATLVRVRPGPARTAGVDRDLFPLTAGSGYQFSLRARADGDQPVTLSIVEAGDAAVHLGHRSTLTLTKDWQLLGGQFQATRNAARPLFTIRANPAAAAIELAEFRFASHDVGRAAAVPQRFTVSNQLNAEGFRDTDHPLRKLPGTYRIAWIGDSYTFGQGVHEPDTFVRRVERALAPRMKEPCEAMNFGVCGYCTQQERVCYEQWAAKYEPDLVVVTMLHNDNLSYKEEQELGFHERPTGAALVRYWQQRSKTYEQVGYEGCLKEVRALHEQCQKNGARLAIVVFVRPTDMNSSDKLIRTVREGLKDKDVPILDLAEAFRAIPFSVQAVHPSDGHPNDLGHAIAAERIVEFLCREVLADKLK